MMAIGYVLTVFSKNGQQHIGIVPYTQSNFISTRIYDWQGVRHHKVGNKRGLKPNISDLYAIARFLDRSAKGYRHSSDAVMQLETWINETVAVGELAA